jgi:hypothetical protein
MGLTPFPADLVLKLAKAYGATAFVETGTFHGATAAWAADHFDTVHTIEVGEVRHRETAARLAHLTNVVFHSGNSRRVLPEIVRTLRGQRKVCYLDGHWSGAGTDGEQDQCPLLEELASLSDEDIIFIDDARIFSRTGVDDLFPPLDPGQWPTMDDVWRALPGGMTVSVIGDVIFAVPSALKDLL